MTLTQHLQASDLHNRSPQQHFVPGADHMMGMVNEPKQVPTTLYGDPILSSGDHVRSASHDSGLGGPTTFPYASAEAPMMDPYPSEMPVIDYDDGMDTTDIFNENMGQWV